MRVLPFLKKLEPHVDALKQKITSHLRRLYTFIGRKLSAIKFNSLRFELSFFITLMVGVILIIFATVLYSILSNTLYAKFDKELEVKARGVSQVIRSYLDVKGGDEEALKRKGDRKR